MSRLAGRINHKSHFLKTRGLQAWLLTTASNMMLGEEGRGELDDEKRKESLKLTWQELPKEALQSSLLDSAGVQPERKNPEVSWSSFSCLFCLFRLLSDLQICVTSCVKAANKVNSELIFLFGFVLFSGNTGLPQKRILEYPSDTW